MLEEEKIKFFIEQKDYKNAINQIIEYVNSNSYEVELLDEGNIVDLDSSVYTILENIDTDSTEMCILFQNLPDIFILMKDPRLILPLISKQYKSNPSGNVLAFYCAKSIFYLIKNYNIDYTDFYDIFYDLITNENLERHGQDIFTFIKIILNESNVSLTIKQGFIKKLARIGLNSSSNLCFNILNLILVLMRLNPVCFSMANDKIFDTNIKENEVISLQNFQPYLFELEILRSGIQPIRKIVNTIINESHRSKEKYDRNFLMKQSTFYDLQNQI